MIKIREQDLQNVIRAELSPLGIFFRCNVGQGYTGSEIVKLPLGRILIKNARPFSTGLPVGTSDIIGAVPVTVTPDMVGQTVAIFIAIEVKTGTGRVRPEQQNFLDVMRSAGARSGVARSPEDAVRIARGAK